VLAYYNGVAKHITVVPVGNGEYLRSDAARQWKRMVAAASRDGIHISAGSGFRSMEEQRYLYNLYRSGRGNTAAVPGYSNHQGGVAMDVSGVGGYGTAAFRWLSSHAGHFGFRNTVPGEFWHWGYLVNG
jgi:LAS superfamily LD-carboxypeptidase LdcB